MSRRLLVAAATGSVLLACQGDNPGERDAGPDASDAAFDTSDATDTGADTAADVPDAGGDTQPNDAVDGDDVPDALVERGFTSTPVAWVEAGTTYAYAVTVWPDDLTVSLLDGPDDATLEDGVLRWDAPADGIDEVTFDLAAFEGEIEVDAQTFDVTVDHPPVFLNLPPQLGYTGEEWRYTPSPEDPDGDAVTLSLAEAPDWLAIVGDAVVGTPPTAGEYVYVVQGDAGPLAATETFSLQVVDRLRDLAFAPAWLPSSGGDIEITGCCFDESTRVYWGADAATDVSRPNAARLIAGFNALQPGQDRLSFAEGEVVVGETATRLLVVPRAEPRFGEVDYVGRFLEGTTLTIRDAESGLALESTTTPTLDGARVAAPASGGFMAAVEINEVASVPVPWGDVDPVVVTAVEPALHAPSSTVTIRFSGEAPTDLRAHWGDVSAACVVDADPLLCRANVPAGALGPLSVTADDAVLQRWAPAAIAASPVTPEWTTASRFEAPTSTALIYVTGVGFDDPAAELEAEGGDAVLVQADGTSAVIRLVPVEGAEAPMRVRLRVGGRTSAWWPLATP